MYKIIEEFPNYIIYDDGRVYSIRRKKFIYVAHDDRGYPYVNFYLKGKRYCRKIHRLVAKAFVPNPNNLPEVNHIDENKDNNHYTNLEWCTTAYNICYGTRHQRAGLTNRTSQPNKRRVGAFKSGKLVQDFISVSEGARFTGDINHRANITACLNGRQKTSYGYEWKYLD